MLLALCVSSRVVPLVQSEHSVELTVLWLYTGRAWDFANFVLINTSKDSLTWQHNWHRAKVLSCSLLSVVMIGNIFNRDFATIFTDTPDGMSHISTENNSHVHLEVGSSLNSPPQHCWRHLSTVQSLWCHFMPLFYPGNVVKSWQNKSICSSAWYCHCLQDGRCFSLSAQLKPNCSCHLHLLNICWLVWSNSDWKSSSSVASYFVGSQVSHLATVGRRERTKSRCVGYFYTLTSLTWIHSSLLHHNVLSLADW